MKTNKHNHSAAVSEIAARPGEDRFAIIGADGVILCTHPTLKGANILMSRYNDTGSF